MSTAYECVVGGRGGAGRCNAGPATFPVSAYSAIRDEPGLLLTVFQIVPSTGYKLCSASQSTMSETHLLMAEIYFPATIFKNLRVYKQKGMQL